MRPSFNSSLKYIVIEVFENSSITCIMIKSSELVLSCSSVWLIWYPLSLCLWFCWAMPRAVRGPLTENLSVTVRVIYGSLWPYLSPVRWLLLHSGRVWDSLGVSVNLSDEFKANSGCAGKSQNDERQFHFL